MNTSIGTGKLRAEVGGSFRRSAWADSPPRTPISPSSPMMRREPRRPRRKRASHFHVCYDEVAQLIIAPR